MPAACGNDIQASKERGASWMVSAMLEKPWAPQGLAVPNLPNRQLTCAAVRSSCLVEAACSDFGIILPSPVDSFKRRQISARIIPFSRETPAIISLFSCARLIRYGSTSPTGPKGTYLYACSDCCQSQNHCTQLNFNDKVTSCWRRN